MTDNKITKNEETALAVSGNLAQMYKDNASVGSENLAGSLPLLKIHAVGRSRNNTLQDGSEPANGNFFYKPTKQQFDEVTCHILTISKGFRTEGFEGKKDVFHQILAGVIIDEGELKPFLMYFTGLKLANLWAFGKEASAFTKAKPVPIPMFALSVKLTTAKQENKFGDAWVVEFEIVKDKKGVPEVVTDEGMFVFLRDTVKQVEETINNLIASKTGEEEIDDPNTSPYVVNADNPRAPTAKTVKESAENMEEEEEEEENNTSNFDPTKKTDDIPF